MDLRGRVPDVSISPDTRAFLLIGFVITMLVLSIAATAAGAGVFLLMMLEGNVMGVIASSVLFSVGLSGAIGGYLWITE